MKVSEEFLDRIEDFLEDACSQGKIIYSSCDKDVHRFVYGRYTLVLIRFLTKEIAILNDEMGYIPNGFVSYVIKTIQPGVEG